jgi:HK97 family phage major capsid protein
MTALRSEIKVIEEKGDEATDEDLSRAEACLVEWDDKQTTYNQAREREAKVDEVMRASIDTGNRENGSTTPAARRSPEFMRRVEPYTEESYTALKRSLVTNGPFDGADAISRAKAATEGFNSLVSDQSRQHIFQLLEIDNYHSEFVARHILMASSDAYNEEFKTFVQTQGQVAGDLMRTALSLTSQNGGYLVPVPVDPTIVLTNTGAINPLREISTIKTIAGANIWNGVTSAGVNAEWLTEGSQASDASPTFGQISITAHKAAVYLFGSYEMLADSGFSQELAMLFADGKNRLEADAMATANTAADRPRGVVAGVLAVTASIVTSATTGAFVAGDVFNTYDAQGARWQLNAKWLANQKIYSKVRQFSTNQGANFWATIGGGQPSELIGQPTYTASSMTGTVGNGTNILLVGDFTNYYILDRIGFSIQYVPTVIGANQRPTGQAGWMGYWRVGAEVANAAAFRLLQLNQVAAATALA